MRVSLPGAMASSSSVSPGHWVSRLRSARSAGTRCRTTTGADTLASLTEAVRVVTVPAGTSTSDQVKTPLVTRQPSSSLDTGMQACSLPSARSPVTDRPSSGGGPVYRTVMRTLSPATTRPPLGISSRYSVFGSGVGDGVGIGITSGGSGTRTIFSRVCSVPSRNRMVTVSFMGCTLV